ncbi:tautomerase family protein [Salinicola halophyticus]|uniref:tautomerase family protein n=1 Tax=Salinicola halophyticus TaxID=1808881 RepID=UPI003F483CCB
MPEVLVHMVEGRTPEQKKMLLQKTTQAVVESLGVRPEQVTVQIVEAKADSKAKGGVLFSER